MAEKTLEEIKADILHRAGRINPFERVKKEDVEQVVREPHQPRCRSLGPGVGQSRA